MSQELKDAVSQLSNIQGILYAVLGNVAQEHEDRVKQGIVFVTYLLNDLKRQHNEQNPNEPMEIDAEIVTNDNA